MAEQLLKVKFPRGTLCKVVTNENEYVEAGEIVTFACNSYSGYTFSLVDGARVTFKSLEDFQTLPLVNSLKFAIDLALSTNDKEWFDELMFQMEIESVEE